MVWLTVLPRWARFPCLRIDPQLGGRYAATACTSAAASEWPTVGR